MKQNLIDNILLYFAELSETLVIRLIFLVFGLLFLMELGQGILNNVAMLVIGLMIIGSFYKLDVENNKLVVKK